MRGLLGWFKCKHPLAALAVEREQTVTPIDRDFDQVVYHLRCVDCGASVEIKHARMVGGVANFLARGGRG